MRRSPLRTAVVVAAIALVAAPAVAPSQAEPARPTPPNLRPLPGEVIDGVDEMVPPADIPRLKKLP